MIELRDYQAGAVQRSRQLIGAGVRRLMLNAPTGAGKTVIAAAIVQGALAKGRRVLFLAHRRELIDQCCDKLRAGGVTDYGVIMSGSRLANPTAAVQVASVQTLLRRELPLADLIIIDEAHRATAGSYQTVLANYPGAVVLGLSATPERLDGRGLDDLFDELVVVAAVPELIAAGHLVRPVCYAAPAVDLSAVRTRRGDYDEGQLAAAVDRPELVGDLVANWQRLAAGRPTVVFAVTVAHAEHIAREFFAAGVSAAWVSGETPTAQREALIADWRAGVVTVVANVYVFTEGFDFPGLECCVLARPTQSVSLYLQQVGRIMRPAPGKTGALVLDHAGCCVTHGQPHLHREWSLAGMARKRKERAVELATVCDDCGRVFEPRASWWLLRDQPLLDRIAIDALAAVRREGAQAGGMATCPECGIGHCRVCRTGFRPEDTEEQCPGCGAIYQQGEDSIGEGAEPYIPATTDDALVELPDQVPMVLTIQNEFKRLLNEAKARGRKRGWAYWRLREQYDEGLLRAALPRHRATWWREVA